MMKTNYVVLLLFVVFSHFASGQNYLNIRNTKTDEVKMILNKKTIYFKVNGDSTYNKGVIQQIKDSSVVLYLPNEDENPLVELKVTDFASIRKPGKFHSIARIISAPLLVVGGVTLMAGTISTISPRNSGLGSDTITQKSNEGPVMLAIGAGAMALGLLPYLIQAKTYDFRKDCVLEIKND